MLEVIKIIFRFILLVAVQVIVLNNIRLGGYINPFIYVLFIMQLPVRIPKTLLPERGSGVWPKSRFGRELGAGRDWQRRSAKLATRQPRQNHGGRQV